MGFKTFIQQFYKVRAHCLAFTLREILRWYIKVYKRTAYVGLYWQQYHTCISL